MIRKTGYTRIKKRQPKQNQGKLYNVIRDKTQIPDDYILMSLGIHSYKKNPLCLYCYCFKEKITIWNGEEGQRLIAGQRITEKLQRQGSGFKRAQEDYIIKHKQRWNSSC